MAPSEPSAEDPDFANLVQRNMVGFRRVARRMLERGGHAPRDVTELIQQASVEFLKQPRSWRDEGHFVALFHKIMKGANGDARKRRYAQKRGAGQADAELPTGGGAVPKTGPATGLARREQQGFVLKALESVSPEAREVVTLRLWEDRSFEDIATAMGLGSADAARMRYNRALEHVQRALRSRLQE